MDKNKVKKTVAILSPLFVAVLTAIFGVEVLYWAAGAIVLAIIIFWILFLSQF